MAGPASARSGGALLREDRVEQAAQPFLVADQRTQLFQFARIARFGNPEPDIPSLGVFVFEVFDAAPEVRFAVRGRAVGQAVLDGAPQNGLGVDAAVGLGDDPAVEGARRTGRRGAVGGGIKPKKRTKFKI